jgi:nitrogen fixation protein NifX
MTVERRLKVVKMRDDAMGRDPAVKVAFATGDMRHVDQHFGAAQSFAIYAVEAQRSSLVEVTQFGRLDMDGNEV